LGVFVIIIAGFYSRAAVEIVIPELQLFADQ